MKMKLLFYFYILRKVFDTIEHKCIFCILELFLLGENFMKVVKLFYKDTNGTVLLPLYLLEIFT